MKMMAWAALLTVLILEQLQAQVFAKTLEETIAYCDDCHGANGVSQDSVIPTIAGFSATTITDMMFAYLDGDRPANKVSFRSGDTARAATDMITITKALSEEEIETLADHYAKQKFLAAKQVYDKSLVEKGGALHQEKCIKCHQAGGSSADDDAGILAGQWTPYLQLAFDEYRSGKRESSAMVKAVKSLSDEEVKALLNFYASQQ